MASNWQEGYPHLESWTGVDWTRETEEKIGIDPYLVWAEATDYVDLGGRPESKKDVALPEKMRVPVIIELAKSSQAVRGVR